MEKRDGRTLQFLFKSPLFTRSLQKLLPEIKKSDLIKGGAGVRAQACDKKGELIDDFLVVEHKKFINICNAPSPAATSSLAIGEQVAKMVVKKTFLTRVISFVV